jgi:hypothetical protein
MLTDAAFLILVEHIITVILKEAEDNSKKFQLFHERYSGKVF